MGIGIHNLSSSGEVDAAATNLSAAIRQTASGLLGTTVQLADLVRSPECVGVTSSELNTGTLGHSVRRRRLHVYRRRGGTSNVRA